MIGIEVMQHSVSINAHHSASGCSSNYGLSNGASAASRAITVIPQSALSQAMTLFVAGNVSRGKRFVDVVARWSPSTVTHFYAELAKVKKNPEGGARYGEQCFKQLDVLPTTCKEVADAIYNCLQDGALKQEGQKNGAPNNVQGKEDTNTDIFHCPISFEVLRDPVIGPCGHTFDRQSIVNWLKRNHNCPCCIQPLEVDQLRTNFAVKDAIEAADTVDFEFTEKKSGEQLPDRAQNNGLNLLLKNLNLSRLNYQLAEENQKLMEGKIIPEDAQPGEGESAQDFILRQFKTQRVTNKVLQTRQDKLEAENQKLNAELTLRAAEDRKVKSAVDKLLNEFVDLEERCDKIKGDIDLCKIEIKKLDIKNEDLTAENNRLQQEKSDLQNIVQQQQDVIVRLDMTVGGQKNTLIEQAKTIDQLQGKLVALAAIVEQQKNDIAVRDSKIDQLTREGSQHDVRVGEFERQLENMQNLIQENFTLQQDKRCQDGQMNQLYHLLERSQPENQKLERENSALKSRIQILETQNNASTRELTGVKQNLQAKELELAEVKQNILTRESELVKKQSELREVQTQLWKFQNIHFIEAFELALFDRKDFLNKFSRK